MMNQSQMFQNLIAQVFSGKSSQDIINELSLLNAQDLQLLLTPTNKISPDVDKVNHLSIMHIFPLHIEVFKWLVEHGGNAFIEDDFGNMPIDLLNPSVDTEAYEKLSEYLEYLKIKEEKDSLDNNLVHINNQKHINKL
jgi:hypothetical protein